jgi:hypothetical protein
MPYPPLAQSAVPAYNYLHPSKEGNDEAAFGVDFSDAHGL